MLERLELVKLAPRRVLDAGSGPPQRALIQRYPGAQVIALDFAAEMLAAPGFGWFRRMFQQVPQPICADLAAIPFIADSIDLAWSSMTLHWVAEPLAALKELARVLAPEGLLMFSTLGPDTLKELRAAAGEARVHRFVDMHDLGDMLVAAGFAAPVMDMEYLTFTYRGPEQLLDDLRASGQTNARRDRPRGLTGKGFLKNLNSKVENRATFEVVYGHAWKGAPRKLADGRDIVQFRSARPS